MFKHLTRIATANQVRAASSTSVGSQVSGATLNKTIHTKVVQQALMMNQRRVPQRVLMQCQLQAFSTIVAHKRDVAALVPDYAVHHSEVADLKVLHLTPEEVRTKHPTEYATPLIRQSQDYTRNVQKNEFLLFNLSADASAEQIAEICAAKGVQVMKVDFKKSIDGETVAHAHVTVGSPSQVKTVKEKLRNFWIADRKVKLKSLEELSYENFDHRTIIVQNIPIHYQNKNLIEIFKNFGAIVNVEMPVKNIAIEKELAEKLDSYVKDRRDNQELSYRRAQKLVQDSIKENEQHYRRILTEALGEQEAEKMLMQIQSIAGFSTEPEQSTSDIIEKGLDNRKALSIQSMISQLQVENAEITKARRVLLSLRDSAEVETPALHSSTGSDTQELISANKDVLQKAINYISQNRENIDEATLSKLNTQLNLSASGSSADPIDKLQALSREQLASAYDTLITCLTQREKLIERRLKSQISHLGVQERVLFQGKDFSKETEDIKPFADPFHEGFVPEEILSVSEQVQNVLDFKNMSPQERLYQLTIRAYNPFLEPNFNESQISMTHSDILDSDVRVPKEPANPNFAPSINQLLFKGYVFTEDNLENLKAQIEGLRDRFDLPFDELYHKEKRLVDAVIQATEALRKREAELPDPMGQDRAFNVAELQGTYLDREYSIEHQFIKDKKKRNEKLLSQSIDGDSGSTSFNFAVNDTKSKIEEYLVQGIINKKEYDAILRMQKEAEEVNLGYAFVTYSHSDEAKLALILGNGMFVENKEIELMVKNDKIDHKDFDTRYQLNKQRNESKVTEELKSLREARKELRIFEQNIDKDLPSLKKLKDFRSLAREVVDNRETSKLGSLVGRTSAEEDALNEKIRALQKENPDVDYTQLFESERAELARKSQHKKAFASYKAFQFLKHGVELQSKGVSSSATPANKATPAPYKSKDPYEFPLVTASVDLLMKSGGRFPQVLDAGEPLTGKAGRKFGYTEDDFMQAYFGKDYARNAAMEYRQENPMFRFNESYKKLFPVDKYLQGPKVEEQRKLIEERFDINDENFQQFLGSIDDQHIEERMVKDTPHPTDANRSLVKDAQTRLENYFNRKAKQTGIEGIWNSREVAGIKKSLREEYFPRPKAAPKEGSDDTKAEEKFEPFFEGEGKQDDSAPASSTDSAYTSGSNSSSGQQHKKKQQQHSGKGGQQQRQDNKGVKKPFQSDSPFYAGQQVEDISVEQFASFEQTELNRDYLYDYKYRQKTGSDVEETVQTKRIQKAAEQNNMNADDLLDQMKDWATLSSKNASRGTVSQKESVGLAKSEPTPSRQTRTVKSIQDFAGSSQDADLSEREDEDIYAHYIRKMKEEKESLQNGPAAKEASIQEHQRQVEELEKLAPEMPRFEGFFNSLSQGKHPFEEKKFTEGHEALKKTPDDIAAEEAYDEELLQRELKGRLMGETLSPRQFALLYEAKVDQSTAVKFQKDNDRKQFLESRDLARIMEELQEQIRRRKVIDGEWNEEESHERLKDMIREAGKEAPEEADADMEYRDMIQLKDFFWQLQTDKKVFEKEYIFDETLGESLTAHVQGIKERFPDLEVLVRRDRDGYPVVKTQYKPKYKYNIDEIVNYAGPEEYFAHAKSSLEEVLKTMLGGGKNTLDHQEIERNLMLLIQNKGNKGSEQFDFDTQTKEAISALWKERVTGKFKNDKEGFAKAFFKLQESATFDETKKLPVSRFGNHDVDPSKVFAQLNEERELITYELAEQLSLRMKEHLYMKERKESDFVKPRRSEQSLFASQVQSNDNAIKIFEKQAASRQARENEQGFDREAYNELKAEIKRRREAKERLLHQGFPELKSYISI